jgi:hypothetical protein
VLAPHYEFSYRGAYSAVTIKAEHLDWIAETDSESEAKEAAKKIAVSLRDPSDIDQFKLPL